MAFPLSPYAVLAVSCMVHMSVGQREQAVGTASGTLALAKAEGQLQHGDQDGAEDGPVALWYDLGMLCHHVQHHVPHLLGDITPDIQQGGDVLIAGREQEVSWVLLSHGTVYSVPQTSHDPEKLS